MWELRSDNLQDQYGKLVPRVTKPQQKSSRIKKGAPTTTEVAPRVAQNSWLGAALEELAQMCGAFLGSTAQSAPNMSPVVERLDIKIHVGDALNVCDALLASPSTVGGGAASDADSPGTTAMSPIAFQRGTLQPLQFRAGVFGAVASTFDVIKSSNLADHLGT